jgi:nicotinamide-nucleotide amidase
MLLVAILTAGGEIAGQQAKSSRSESIVDYVIVVTGAELLSGVYPDGHTYFLTNALRPLGLRCVGSISVDDDPEEIRTALEFARGKAPLILVTGGLGATRNDVTRTTLSRFTDIPLKEHPDLVERLAGRYGVSADRLRENVLHQTRVPVEGTYLPNGTGSAVGLVFDQGPQVFVALPGPPRELQPMVRDELVPYLMGRFGVRLPGCSTKLRFVGVGQSQIEQTIEEHVTMPEDMIQQTQFQSGRVDYTFFLPSDTSRDRQCLERLKQEILQHLGKSVYADNETSLEQHVVNLLKRHRATLTVAEMGSQGYVATALRHADPQGEVLERAYLAASAEKLQAVLPNDVPGAGAQSNSADDALLDALRRQCDSWVLVVGEPSGDRQTQELEVTLSQPDGERYRSRHRLRGEDESSYLRLVTSILDGLRQHLNASGEPNS